MLIARTARSESEAWDSPIRGIHGTGKMVLRPSRQTLKVHRVARPLTSGKVCLKMRRFHWLRNPVSLSQPCQAGNFYKANPAFQFGVLPPARCWLVGGSIPMSSNHVYRPAGGLQQRHHW